MDSKDEFRVANLSWDQVAERIETSPAILPIGAGAKEHGFHLPMNTDQIQAEWLAARLAREFDALVWPTLTYGFYPAFEYYAGSASLTVGTFRATIAELVAGILSYGAKRVFILNTGISTLQPVEDVLAAKFAGKPVVHLRIHDGPRYREAANRLSEQAIGTHADELETSRMLVLCAEKVRMEQAAASPPGKGDHPVPLSPDDPESPNYSPSGSWGDPTLATPEKGEALLKAMHDDVRETVRDAIRDTSLS